MKRLIFLIFFIPVLGFSQVSDDSLRTYNDTYIIENTTNSITATMVNTILENIILSKVNVDSATTVRWSTEYDTAFFTWYGRSEDTLFFYASDANPADQDTLYMGDEVIYFNTGTSSGDSTWVQIFVDSLGGIGNCVEKAYIDTIVGCSPVYVSGGVSTTTVVTTNLGTAGSHVEMAYIDTCDIGTVFNQDIEVDGGWQTWTPTLTWTTATPTVNATVAQYMRVNNTIYYLLYVNFTTGGTPPTALNATLPTAPKDIDVSIVDVGFISRTGSTYSKGQYPYIDAASNTAGDRKLYVPTFSIVASTQYGWTFQGFYRID